MLDVDKSIYDITDPNYTQVHCIRFEYEKGSTGYKITDIDFYLEGNRHAKANASEWLYGE